MIHLCEAEMLILDSDIQPLARFTHVGVCVAAKVCIVWGSRFGVLVVVM